MNESQPATASAIREAISISWNRLSQRYHQDYNRWIEQAEDMIRRQEMNNYGLIIGIIEKRVKPTSKRKQTGFSKFIQTHNL